MTVREEVRIGDFLITPYEVPASPTAADPAAKILSMYKEKGQRTIRSASLVRFAERAVTADLDENDRDQVFDLAAAVAFAGLSARSFFEHFGYCNRDSFQCILQQFTDASFISIVSRRRDGSRHSVWPTDEYRVDLEPHVDALAQHRIEAQFVEAVRKGMS
jgi:hypothetical protein